MLKREIESCLWIYKTVFKINFILSFSAASAVLTFCDSLHSLIFFHRNIGKFPKVLPSDLLVHIKQSIGSIYSNHSWNCIFVRGWLLEVIPKLLIEKLFCFMGSRFLHHKSMISQLALRDFLLIFITIHL